jgi:hypothetical protein
MHHVGRVAVDLPEQPLAMEGEGSEVVLVPRIIAGLEGIEGGNLLEQGFEPGLIVTGDGLNARCDQKTAGDRGVKPAKAVVLVADDGGAVCFKTKAIYASVNFDAIIASAPSPNRESTAENSNQERSSFRESEHSQLILFFIHRCAAWFSVLFRNRLRAAVLHFNLDRRIKPRIGLDRGGSRFQRTQIFVEILLHAFG